MTSNFVISVHAPKDQEVEFKHEFRNLASKFTVLAPPEGFFGPMSLAEKYRDRDRKLKGMADDNSSQISEDPDFKHLKSNCWKTLGLPKNLVGGTFEDEEDDTLYKVIGYQPLNPSFPIVTITESGERKKWPLREIQTYFGIAQTKFVVEEIHDDGEESSSDSSDSSSYISVTTATTTIVPSKEVISKGPPTPTEDVSHLSDLELSMRYGFSKNVIGTRMNIPTPKRGYDRFYTILRLETRKIKYPVVAKLEKSGKEHFFTVDQVKPYLID